MTTVNSTSRPRVLWVIEVRAQHQDSWGPTLHVRRTRAEARMEQSVTFPKKGLSRIVKYTPTWKVMEAAVYNPNDFDTVTESE